MQLIIGIGDNKVDVPLFQGFLTMSPGAPKVTACELLADEKRLIVGCESVNPSELAELLRVLGGSAKGDDPMVILEPADFAGQQAQPAEPPGARRWPCPRCNDTVIEGRNAEPGFNGGLCQKCAAVDRQLAGGRVLATPAQPPPMPAQQQRPMQVQVPAHLQKPEVMARVPFDARPALSFTPLVCVDNYVELASLTPPFPTLVFVVDMRALALWNGFEWRVCETVYPPVL